ncbi:MAG: RNA polymerase sigma factor [Pseudomonadota bacterium]
MSRATSGAVEAPDDDRLLAAFAAGDRSAAAVLTTRLAPVVYKVAMRMLNNRAEAEDVTQESLLRLWRMAPSWQPGKAQVSTWLYRVALNLCRDRMRRVRGGTVDIASIAEPPDDSPSVSDAMLTSSRNAALQGALATLPERQRQAVILRHIEEWPNPDIAAAMDISVEAVESLTARGKRALAAALKGRRDELGFADD